MVPSLSWSTVSSLKSFWCGYLTAAVSVIGLFVLFSCGLPSNEGIAAALENEFAPLTITIMNETGVTVDQVRVCRPTGECFNVLGVMFSLEAANIGPIDLGEAYIEWTDDIGVRHSQKIWVVVTNPMYFMRAL